MGINMRRCARNINIIERLNQKRLKMLKKCVGGRLPPNLYMKKNGGKLGEEKDQNVNGGMKKEAL